MAPATLLQTAQAAPYTRLFQKDFSTFVLEAVTPREFADGFTDAEYAAEKADMYQLAKYLLQSYSGTGKTFVLQNWEGDWKLNGNYTASGFEGMRRYFSARQEGVNQARSEIWYVSGVTVLHAAEVNRVTEAYDGQPRAVNNVLPYVSCDLYSYSVWDLPENTPDYLIRNLDYMQAQIGVPRDRIFLGEYGQPSSYVPTLDAQRDIVRDLTHAVLGWGVRYAIYWEVFCNAFKPGYSAPATSEKMQGYWLVTPENVNTPLYWYFADLLRGSMYSVTLKNLAYDKFMVAEYGSGPVYANRDAAGAWETFVLTDLNGGTLLAGDTVSIQTLQTGMYVAAENGGGGAVNANRRRRGPWEEFVIQDNHPSDGQITSTDHVGFRASGGLDLRSHAVSDPVYPGHVRATGTRPQAPYFPYESLWVIQIN